LTAADVTSAELILPTAAPIVSQLALEDSDPNWLPPPVRVHLMLTGLRLAEAGFGVLVSDPLTATTFKTESVRLLAWKPGIQIDYCIVVKKDLPESETTSHLIERLIASAKIWREEHTHLHTAD
jgi:DNA-binding transcriptional LysR family regulator